MKGVTYIKDKKNRKTAVVIDLKTLKKFDEHVEELFDVIIAESRVEEPSIKWEKVKTKLKLTKK